MTDFNALPLAEQLKALQAGDELHLRGGGWLPFVEYGYQTQPVMCAASLKIMITHDTEDIIRVIRPTERKVPDVVEIMRNFNSHDYDCAATALANILADHFEKG